MGMGRRGRGLPTYFVLLVCTGHSLPVLCSLKRLSLYSCCFLFSTKLMTLTGDRGSPIVRGRWTSPRHMNREGETQASGVADTADETEARLKRFILYICRPQMHASHGSIRLRWSHKSTFRDRLSRHPRAGLLAVTPGASYKKLTKQKYKNPSLIGRPRRRVQPSPRTRLVARDG